MIFLMVICAILWFVCPLHLSLYIMERLDWKILKHDVDVHSFGYCIVILEIALFLQFVSYFFGF